MLAEPNSTAFCQSNALVSMLTLRSTWQGSWQPLQREPAATRDFDWWIVSLMENAAWPLLLWCEIWKYIFTWERQTRRWTFNIMAVMHLDFFSFAANVSRLGFFFVCFLLVFCCFFYLHILFIYSIICLSFIYRCIHCNVHNWYFILYWLDAKALYVGVNVRTLLLPIFIQNSQGLHQINYCEVISKVTILLHWNILFPLLCLCPTKWLHVRSNLVPGLTRLIRKISEGLSSYFWVFACSFLWTLSTSLDIINIKTHSLPILFTIISLNFKFHRILMSKWWLF